MALLIRKLPKAVAKPALPTMALNPKAKILFVVDPPIIDDNGKVPSGPMSNKLMNGLAYFMKRVGITSKDIVMVAACKPVTKDVWDSDKKLGEAIKADHEAFMSVVGQFKPKFIIASGKAAARQVYNRAVKITKIRGVSEYLEEVRAPVLPILGIAHVMRVPEHSETMLADLLTAKRIIDAGHSIDKENEEYKTDYRWCTDLTFMLAKRPKIIGLDTESSAFGHADFPHWYVPETKVLTVQISDKPGTAYVVPIDYPGYPIKPDVRAKLVRQLKILLEDPGVKKVGQNLKHDWLQFKAKLGITMQGYEDDTLLLAHMLNENMQSKALDEIARVHLPKMAGYKDQFRRKYEKKSKTSAHDTEEENEDTEGNAGITRMDLVKPDDILAYSGADADTVLQLHGILTDLLQKDQKNYHCYRTVVMPAMRAFCDIEYYGGFKINTKALYELRLKVQKKQDEEYKRLIAMIPKVILDQFRDTGVGLKLTRDALLRAFLFTHPKGLRLKPVALTKTGLPSVSTKQAMPYYVGKHPFIEGIIAYVKNAKMLGTYIGEERDANGQKTGFWKYIHNGFVRPTYQLHVTVTGRSSSRDPNGQNFPKRGEFAKDYRALFEAPEGWVLLEADYSQLELRIAGILSNEPTFIKLYREGADIHCATAAVVMGISLDDFMRLKQTDPDTFALQRFRAKAVNFGFIYGMGWRKFRIYAKTDYGIDYTDEEAQRIRQRFFRKYTKLELWHDAVKAFANKHGFVRAIDGRVRHLPAVASDDNAVSSSAERQAVNSPVQGLGSDLGLIALTRLNAEVGRDWLRVVGFVHDAIICIAKKGREMEAARIIKQYMESNPLEEMFKFKSPIPIVSEVSMGMNLSKMIELRDSWLHDKRIGAYEQVKALQDAIDAENKARKEPTNDNLAKAAAEAKAKADAALTGRRMLRIPPKPRPRAA